MKTEYEPDTLGIMIDVLYPCIPVVGLSIIPFALIDINCGISWVEAQGRVRLASVLISHLIWLIILIVVTYAG